MSQGLDMTVNSLPSRTWNWLKMNESKLKEIEAGDTWDVKEVAGESEEMKIRKFFPISTQEWVRIWTV